MASDLTTVEIPIEDLAITRAALNSAYHQNTVLDLAEQYRKLSQRHTSSKLTQALEHALTLNAQHMDQALAEDDEAEPDA